MAIPSGCANIGYKLITVANIRQVTVATNLEEALYEYETRCAAFL